MTTIQLLLDRPRYWQPGGDSPSYHLRLANTAADVLAAQRLRHQVYGSIDAHTPGPAGLDAEPFDDRCDHLIVWYRPAAGQPQAVATCRLFPPHSNDNMPRGVGLHADREFGLMPLERLLDSTVELGRACVAPAHRSGAAASLLWGGAVRYLRLTGYRYLLGCGSMHLRDGGQGAAAFWDLALTGYLAPAQRRCRPRDPIAIGSLSRAVEPDIPPLLRACLRMGAQVCGPPGYNEMAGSADFLLLLDLRDAEMRCPRGFLHSDS